MFRFGLSPRPGPVALPHAAATAAAALDPGAQAYAQLPMVRPGQGSPPLLRRPCCITMWPLCGCFLGPARRAGGQADGERGRHHCAGHRQVGLALHPAAGAAPRLHPVPSLPGKQEDASSLTRSYCALPRTGCVPGHVRCRREQCAVPSRGPPLQVRARPVQGAPGNARPRGRRPRHGLCSGPVAGVIS